MGYDCARFLIKVDEEFVCSICMLVIENPVQTPCEHLFCSKCINDWLLFNKRCPIDSEPLTTNDLSDHLRNLLNKLDIKCDFQSAGCQTITKLESLEHHVSKCVYNLNKKVVCDRGCNLTMTRRDYQKNDNCISHLAKEVAVEIEKVRHELSQSIDRKANRQAVEITKRRHEISDQKSYFERTVNRQAEEITKLRHELSEQKCHFERQAEEITKLRHDLNEQKCRFERTVSRRNENIRKHRDECSRQKELIENSKTGQKQEITELCTDNLVSEPPKWQLKHNIKVGLLNLLEIGNVSRDAFVQSAHALDTTKSCFKIHCTTLAGYGFCYVGLTRRGFFRDVLDGTKSIFQLCSDCDKANNFLDFLQCKNGDVIECGIEFPKDFTNDGNNSAPIHLSVNQTVIFQKNCVIPKDGLFPTIIWWLSSGIKVRYYQQIK